MSTTRRTKTPQAAAATTAAGPATGPDDGRSADRTGTHLRDAAAAVSLVTHPTNPTQTLRDRKSRRERRTRDHLRKQGKTLSRRATSQLRVVLAAAADPHTYELAAELPPPAGTGRPQDYPNWTRILMGAGIEAWGTGENMIANLQEPSTWKAVLDEVRAARGDAEVDSMRRQDPPQTHHWTYFKRICKKNPAIVDRIHQAFRRTAVEKATAQGRLDPAKEWRLADPDPDDYLYGDGAVHGSPSRTPVPVTEDPETGLALRRRFDNARGIYYQGGSDSKIAASGTKFVWVFNRGWQLHTRLVMDVQHQAVGHPGGEGALLVEMFQDILALAPGVKGLITDGILHDVHCQKIMALGRIPVAPLTAAQSGPGYRVPKIHAYRVVEHGNHKHDLQIGDGNVYELTRQGKKTTLTVLDVVGRVARHRADGSLDASKTVFVPCTRAPGFTHRVSISDRPPGTGDLKLAEYLRMYGNAEAAYRKIYSRRVDAEAGIAQAKKPLRDNRVPAYGGEAQTLTLLLMAHGRNAVSQYLFMNPDHMRTGPLPPGAANMMEHRTPIPSTGFGCCCQDRLQPDDRCEECRLGDHRDCSEPVTIHN